MYCCLMVRRFGLTCEKDLLQRVQETPQRHPQSVLKRSVKRADQRQLRSHSSAKNAVRPSQLPSNNRLQVLHHGQCLTPSRADMHTGTSNTSTDELPEDWMPSNEYVWIQRCKCARVVQDQDTVPMKIGQREQVTDHRML